MELKWAVAAIFINRLFSLERIFEPAGRRAGRHGEEIAAEIIRRVLRKDDCLLTNIEVTHDGRQAEMDGIVVNRFGVFIFEVCVYSPKLYVSKVIGKMKGKSNNGSVGPTIKGLSEDK